MKEPMVTVETVTPSMAELWLAGNTNNRRMKTLAVTKYAKDIAAGKWDLNGESIKFNGDGRLLDGQNRLAAVIEARAPITTVVVRGLDAESQDTMDVGVPRRLADVLTIRGEVNTVDLATGLIRLYQYTINPEEAQWNRGPSIHQALALLEVHPTIRASVNAAERVRKAVGLRSGVGVGLHYVLTSIDQDDAEAYFERLINGANLSTDDPVYHLRRLLLDARVSSHQRVKRRTRPHDWALCVKAWNAYREGRTIKMLVWRPGGAHPESFPVPE